MNNYKSFFAAFSVVLAMMFSCSQETEINDSKLADSSQANLTVNIIFPITRTVRPEISKYDLELKDASSGEVAIVRTINAPATSTTFKNIAVKTYIINVFGYAKNEKGDDVQIVKSEEITINKDDFKEINLFRDIEVDDFYEGTTDGKDGADGKGGVKISFTFGENFRDKLWELCKYYGYIDSSGAPMQFPYVELTIPSDSEKFKQIYFWDFYGDPNSHGKMKDDILNKMKIGVEKAGLTPGSYKVEVKDLPLEGSQLLVRDPIINIYSDITTEVTWELNDSQLVDNINDQVDSVKIPVWNDGDDNSSSSVGFINSNRLLVKPVFYNENIEYVSSAYGFNRRFWILGNKKDVNGAGTYWLYKELRTENYVDEVYDLSENDAFQGDNSLSDVKDFTIVTVGNMEYFLFVNSGAIRIYKYGFVDSNLVFTHCKDIYLPDTVGSSDSINSMAITGNILTTATATTAMDNPVDIDYYVAVSTVDNSVPALHVYKGSYNTANDGTDVPTNAPSEMTIDIPVFDKFKTEDNDSLPDKIKVTDVYTDGEYLYITAGTCKRGADYKNSYSFGGLFGYGIEGNNLTYNKRSISTELLAGYPKKLSVPRGIVPVNRGKASYLYIVDSGFGCNKENETDPLPLVKCSRICVFNKDVFDDKNIEQPEPESMTNLHESARFDFDRISNDSDYCF